jgi:hypothetical protein
MSYELTLVVTAIWISREIYHTWNTHKLINKLMSRSYYDFKLAENSGTLEKTTPVPHQPTVEDLDWDAQKTDMQGIFDGIG